jgi:hypothetical protein
MCLGCGGDESKVSGGRMPHREGFPPGVSKHRSVLRRDFCEGLAPGALVGGADWCHAKPISRGTGQAVQGQVERNPRQAGGLFIASDARIPCLFFGGAVMTW